MLKNQIVGLNKKDKTIQLLEDSMEEYIMTMK